MSTQTGASLAALPTDKVGSAAHSDEKVTDDIVASRHSTDYPSLPHTNPPNTANGEANLQVTQTSTAVPPNATATAQSTTETQAATTQLNPDAASAAPAANAPVRGRVHAFRVNSSRFIVDAKYLPLRPLGRGAYGVVCSAVDQDTNRKVAIKKIGNAFDDVVDAKRILREVKMLHHFQHENIVGLVDLVEPPPGYPFKDVYMVLEFMETDLHKIIYSKNELTDDHVQYFIYQALRALKYIHSARVVHRDLKPSNLLLNGNCDLKICDFGLARGLDETSPDTHLTEYVVTRWYRAPEVMYSVQDYSYQIDVWALGCILAELLGRAPLWPGEDYIKQMNLIFDVLGTPSEEDMSVITNARALTYIRSLPPRPRVPWNQLFPHASELSLDLLDRMLQFNPARRITVEHALQHPYFADLRNPESETECAVAFDYSFEREGKTREDLQRFMWDEIYAYRPWLKGQRGRGRHEEDDEELPADAAVVAHARAAQAATGAAARPPLAPPPATATAAPAAHGTVHEAPHIAAADTDAGVGTGSDGADAPAHHSRVAAPVAEHAALPAAASTSSSLAASATAPTAHASAHVPAPSASAPAQGASAAAPATGAAAGIGAGTDATRIPSGADATVM